MNVFKQTISRTMFKLRLVLFTATLVGTSLVPMLSNPSISRADDSGSCSPYGVAEGSGWLSGGAVNVCSNGGNVYNDNGPNCVPVTGAPGGSGCSAGNVYSGDEWQCVELVNRLYLTKGWITSTWFGNGNTLVNDVPAGLVKQNDAAISYLNPGDVITLDDGDSGHAGIINSVSGTTVYITNQNASLNSTANIASGTSLSSGNADLDMVGWAGYAVQAVVHAPDASRYHYHPFSADFNGDGYADIGLYDQNIGTFYIKHGPSFSDQITYQWAAGANYQPLVGDFNHDGYADIGLRDVNSGMIYIKHGPSFGDQVTYQWAAGANYQVLAADFNADGYADIGLRDMNTGMFYIKHGPSFSDQITYQWAAGSNYVPLAADFNHDGYADIGLYDQYAGMFYIKHGTGFSDQLTYQWAAGSNYQPFAADFNDDGYADIGLRDANIGMFYIKHGTSFGDQVTYQWAGG